MTKLPVDRIENRLPVLRAQWKQVLFDTFGILDLEHPDASSASGDAREPSTRSRADPRSRRSDCPRGIVDENSAKGGT